MVFYKNMNTSVSIKILLLLVESENSITRKKISSCLAQNPRFKFDEFWHSHLCSFCSQSYYKISTYVTSSRRPHLQEGRTDGWREERRKKSGRAACVFGLCLNSWSRKYKCVWWGDVQCPAHSTCVGLLCFSKSPPVHSLFKRSRGAPGRRVEPRPWGRQMRLWASQTLGMINGVRVFQASL